VYQSEFPVDQPVPVFDPTLLFLLILAGLAIAGLAFFAGRLTGRGDKGEKRGDVPKIIHDAVKAKCVAASSAPSGELVAKTQELIEEVTLRVGPLLAFGGPCAKAFKLLGDAMKGEAPEAKKKDEGKHGHAHGKDHDKGHGAPVGGGHDAHGADEAKKDGAASVGLLTRKVTILAPQTVVIANAPAPERPREDHPKPAEEAPKALEHKEYVQLLRLAVAEFSDFWNRPNCLRELEDCQKVLTETKPVSKPQPGGSEHHR
jgi:hypothetical protein